MRFACSSTCAVSFLCPLFVEVLMHCIIIVLLPVQCGQCERVSVVAKNRKWRWEKRRPTATVRQNAAQKDRNVDTRTALGPCTSWSASKEKKWKTETHTHRHTLSGRLMATLNAHTQRDILKEPRDKQVFHREKKIAAKIQKQIDK